MKDTQYYQSGQHTANIIEAGKKSREVQHAKKTARLQAYQANPSLCTNPQCSSPIPYLKRNNKFCSSSCAATVNNQSRTPSLEHRKKVSAKLTGRESPNKGRMVGGRTVCQVFFRNCKHCDKLFTDRQDSKHGRKTCSLVCSTSSMIGSRTYQNGSRKPSWFYNRYMNKDVLLDSSWEVSIAQQLDDANIIWIRPDPIPWIDAEGKSHLYYPDFFLPDHNLYLDPKNPYCMIRDQYKMSEVEKKIDIKYGDINNIIDVINNLLVYGKLEAR